MVWNEATKREECWHCGSPEHDTAAHPHDPKGARAERHPEAMPDADVTVLVDYLISKAPLIPRDELREGIENWTDHHWPGRTMTIPEMIEALEAQLEFYRTLESEVEP